MSTIVPCLANATSNALSSCPTELFRPSDPVFIDQIPCLLLHNENRRVTSLCQDYIHAVHSDGSVNSSYRGRGMNRLADYVVIAKVSEDRGFALDRQD